MREEERLMGWKWRLAKSGGVGAPFIDKAGRAGDMKQYNMQREQGN